MSDETANLASIPFSNLIGGPLSAAVQAQAQAAQTCIEFIEQVGFIHNGTGRTDEVRSVKFQYMKTPEDGGTEQKFELSVPILAIIPLPYLRVDEVLIDFNAKITQQASVEQSTSTTGMWSYGASAGWGWGRAHFYGSQSRKSDSTSKSSSAQEYNMSVKVRAVQAEVPGGMQKILDILEKAVVDKRATQQTP